MTELPTEWEDLTARQVELLDALIEEGETNASIAERTGLSEKTVYTYLGRAYVVMGARSRVDAALMWDRWRRGPGRAQA